MALLTNQPLQQDEIVRAEVVASWSRTERASETLGTVNPASGFDLWGSALLGVQYPREQFLQVLVFHLMEPPIDVVMTE